MKTLLKKLLPPSVIDRYHKILALFAASLYDNPSNKLIVIGVTGTNGKSTVVNLIGKILEEAGNKVGWASTANFRIAGLEWLNDKKMTMPGRFQMQRLLNQMAAADCQYAIIETSSEGIKQHRHLGINYDIIIFTNLTPEHLEAHGGFENYKKAKGELFAHLTRRPHKTINGRIIDKTIIVNADDQNAGYYLSFKADKKIKFSLNNPSDFKAEAIELKSNGTLFTVNNSSYRTNLLGRVNIYNCLAAIAVAKTQHLPEATIKEIFLKYQGLPGRFEWINTGKNFKVMADYAPEPESMKKLYETLQIFHFNNIVHVLGSCGGGRDKARRPILGKLAAANAQYIIVTNEDPYDDDPVEIIDNVAEGALEQGKILNQNLFKIADRREAIKKALSLAQENDLILLTGKGCEQYICVAKGKKIPWDDRKAVKELLITS
ncbi:MAG: UDP-N-acetylmuramoyl-L-alanyl-D-glutamate--2,6-diaminopimelate ligase [Candidatus Komeilibacteria bacterium]|nr:UDP-N-acetylmuramoyl-L-alanyl-D-glutamate--2,6-diaminopimelate ligase [Candidatus Komeilibacteria bacterium]